MPEISSSKNNCSNVIIQIMCGPYRSDFLMQFLQCEGESKTPFIALCNSLYRTWMEFQCEIWWGRIFVFTGQKAFSLLLWLCKWISVWIWEWEHNVFTLFFLHCDVLQCLVLWSLIHVTPPGPSIRYPCNHEAAICPNWRCPQSPRWLADSLFDMPDWQDKGYSQILL